MKRLLCSLFLVAGLMTVFAAPASAAGPHFGRIAFWNHTSPSQVHYHAR
ncbi:MAG: hypothetical protein KDA90_13035 [Planctomycetaceae bacterium]|nr:hypothetical protein [Planctomycetaceae bacterium]